MTNVNVNVKVIGLRKFGKKVANQNAKLNNMEPAYKAAVVLYHRWIIRNFNAQGNLHDNKGLIWPQLKESTKKRRRKKGSGAKILIDTGSLRRDWELRSSSNQGVIKSKKFYSSVHEEGTKKAGKNRNITIPQRKIFPEIPQTQKIIRPAFEKHLKWG